MKNTRTLKTAGVVLAGAAVLGGMAVAGAAKAQAAKPTITLWTFTTEKPQIKYLKEKNYPANIKEVVIPYANFQTKLDQVIGTSKGPDMVALDAGFVEKYVDSGKLADLGKAAKTAAKHNYKYTLDMGKDAKGKQVALSYQAAPGTYYYNTKVFNQYLGIKPDDVAAAQSALSSWDNIEKTAQTIKDKSGGKAYLFSSLEEIYNPVIGARKTGWVVDNKLKIDKTMTASLDTMKKFVDNKWTKNTTAQSSDWFAGMGDNSIATYALPSWGLFYWLQDYTKGKPSEGQWHITQGPVSYSWGGTWLGAVSGSKNEAAAKKLAIYWSTNKAFQTWEAKTQNDFVARQDVNNTVGKTAKVSLLGGQNPYPIFNKVAKNINGKNQTKYDQNIQSLWINDVVNPYANGKKSKAAALKAFKNDVKAAYPSLTV